MASRFQVFCRPIIAKVDLVESISEAAMSLHNYLMADRLQDGTNQYCPPSFDRYGNNRHRDGDWINIVQYDNDDLIVYYIHDTDDYM